MDNNTFIIRPAELKDIDTIVECILSAYSQGKSWVDDSKYLIGNRTNSETIERIINSKDKILFVYEIITLNQENIKEYRIIGTVCGKLENYLPHLINSDKYIDINEQRCIISFLSVDPDYQSKGLGKFLMKYIEDFYIESKRLAINNVNLIAIEDFQAKFVNNNIDKLKRLKEFMVTCVDEKVELVRFYNRLNYHTVGYREKSSNIDFQGLQQKSEFHIQIYTKDILI